jgi:hypothetical protein
MVANLRKCLITTRQSFFCVLFFDAINIFLCNSKNKSLLKKPKMGIMKLKTFISQQTIILKTVRLYKNINKNT